MSVNLSDIPRGMTCCLSVAGLTLGSDANDIKIAAPNGAGVDFVINGIAYHKADTDDIEMTPGAVQPVSTSCLYLVCLDTAGALSVVKGANVSTAAFVAGAAVLNWPEPVAGTCPIGAVKIDTNATTTFTIGTTDFSAAGITDTFYNFIGMPSAPLKH